MKSYLPEYELTQASTLEDALTKLNSDKISPIAGGTDLMVLLDAGKLPGGKFLDINNISSLLVHIDIINIRCQLPIVNSIDFQQFSFSNYFS